GLDQTLASSFGLQKPDGALVSSVDPKGPAAKAGLQPGDVILAVNGRPVTSPEQLRDAVKNAGNSLALLIQRDDAQ
ncbi:PDZ domain-containing protein, partial [Burkholderia gladioli]|uniref:PDZ domain-containing protein n=1 Tax=Burkholderia gladioli TaxID=28095 RepID=UPI00163E1551